MKQKNFFVIVGIFCLGCLLATAFYLYHEVYLSLGESKEVAALVGDVTQINLNVEKFENVLKVIVAKQGLAAKKDLPDPFIGGP